MSYDFEFVEDIFFVRLTDKSYARDLITDDFEDPKIILELHKKTVFYITKEMKNEITAIKILSF